MRNHLKFVHKSAHVEADEAPSSRQTSLKLFNKSRAALGKSKHEQLNRSLAWMCAVDLRPISVVTGEGFRRYSNMLNPSYSVPCRATVAHQVQLLYKEGKEELISELQSLPVAMTTDLWTSVA